jgi:hypothetical protein
MSDRIFVDPDRHDEWQVRAQTDLHGRRRLAFTRGAVTLWSAEDPPSEIESIPDTELRKLYRASCREIRHGEHLWLVRWEDREFMEIWTWFESATGEKRVMETQVPFPFLGESTLCGALERARSVTD